MKAWLEDAKRVPIIAIASALGLTIGRDGKSVSPCPGCGGTTRAGSGRHDRRGRCAVLGLGFHCYTNGSSGCGASGNGPGLVAWVLTGRPWHAGDAETTRRVRAWFASNGWCDPAEGDAIPTVPRRIVAIVAPEPPPSRPDPHEVALVWFHAPAVTNDDEVASLLASRGLDPTRIAELDLARALPSDVSPHWAHRGRQPWQATGHRLIVPLWEPDPRMSAGLRIASLHARCVRPCDANAKATSPQGHSHKGLVMATGEDFLADGRERKLLTIVEGIPDLLTWALQPASARGALIGGISGSANPAILALVPTDWTIAVATHADLGGDAQGNAWKREIERRGCRYVRCKPRSAA